MDTNVLMIAVEVILLLLAAYIIYLGAKGEIFQRHRSKSSIQLSRRSTFLFNLMIALMIIAFVLSFHFDFLLKYNIFIMVGIALLFIVIILFEKK